MTSPMIVSALFMGLFGGVHCVTMCGGVVSVLCSASERCPTAAIGAAAAPAGPATGASGATVSNGARRFGQAPYWLAYNLGRVASYTLLGALFGTLGTLSTGLFPLEGMRFALRAFAVVTMLAVGLHLAGLPSVMTHLESIGAPLWRKLAPSTRRFLPLRTPAHALVLGGIWGLMPCGLLYGALALAASAESTSTGAATMAAFGLGTLPVMVTASALAHRVTRALGRAWVRRAAGCMVLAFGLWSSAGMAAQLGIGAPFGIGTAHRHCCPTR